MQAVFLRHEGYLGALGALMSYGDPSDESLTFEESKEKVSSNKYILCMFMICPTRTHMMFQSVALCIRKMLFSTITNKLHAC